MPFFVNSLHNRMPALSLILLQFRNLKQGRWKISALSPFREETLLVDEKRIRPYTLNRREFPKLSLIEMLHLWFGDLVTMKWWDDPLVKRSIRYMDGLQDR